MLVRHGHVPGIQPERFRGGAHLELTEQGLREARLTAERIARQWQPVIVYTSPRTRCIETGRCIAERCGIPDRVLEDIYDLDYGEWTDHTHEDMRAAHPAEYQRWRTAPQLVRFPGGNCLQEVATRVADAIRFVAKTHAGGTVVLVGHDSGNRTLMLQALGLPLSSYWNLRQTPCGISEFVVGADAIHVVRMNETAHLEVADASRQ
ncbi:MAG TPA: histidine phosphatase family protein [Steroidobacteraceae bacterium]